MRSLVRLVVMVMLGIFVASFLLLGIGVALFSVVWSLLRGRKPAMFTVFQFFRQTSQQFGGGKWTGRAPHSNAPAGDIVDVQAHEVRPSLAAGDEQAQK